MVLQEPIVPTRLPPYGYRRRQTRPHVENSKRQAKIKLQKKREYDCCLSVVEALRKPDLKDKQSNTHAVCTRMQDSVLWTKQERLCPKAHPAYLYSIPVSIISGIRHCSNLEISQVPTTSDKAVIDAILSCRCQALNTPIGVHSLIVTVHFIAARTCHPHAFPVAVMTIACSRRGN